MTEFELGQGQMKVMRVLWEKKRATAQEIIDELNKVEPVRRSTVQTFLRILERKGVISHDVDKRTFIFYPLVTKEEITEHAFHRFMNHVFEGSMEGLVSYIVNNEKISSKEMDKIKKLLEEKEK